MALLAVLTAPAWADEGDYQVFSNIHPGYGSRTGTGQAGTEYNNRPATPRGRFGIDCPGYIDEADNAPDHKFWVVDEVDLILTVNSNVDTVLVVAGPVQRSSQDAGSNDNITSWGELRCDDSGASSGDDRISARFQRGEYHVWVGVYDIKDNAGRYVLDIRENPETDLKPLPPLYLDFDNIAPGFAGGVTRGINGAGAGSQDASTFGSHCIGVLDSIPDHTITVTSPVNLQIRVDSNNDASLVVRGPSGTFCDNDSAGNLDPQLTTGRLDTGTYEVYVGAVGKEGGSYLLTVTEVTGANAAVGNPTPTSGDDGSRLFGISAGDTVRQQHPELVQLIMEAESMDDAERQEWLGRLPSMTDEQLQKLREILETEKRKLEELEMRYQQELLHLNQRTIGLAPGFGSNIAKGVTGGDSDDRIAGRGAGHCPGAFSREPNHRFTLTEKMALTWTVNTSGTVPVLWISGSNWNNCEPSGYFDLLARSIQLEGDFSPGEYQVWVGNRFFPAGKPYVLTLSEGRSSGSTGPVVVSIRNGRPATVAASAIGLAVLVVPIWLIRRRIRKQP